MSCFTTEKERPDTIEMLVEALRDSQLRMKATLAAMDRYNDENGTYIIGPSLLGLANQIALNEAALAKAKP